MHEFQTVHKFQSIDIKYLLNLQFFRKMVHSKHTQAKKEQKTVESVFISRFTMNNIAPKMQKCWTLKIAFKIISKMLKQPNFFYSQPLHFQRTHLESFTFLWLIV